HAGAGHRACGQLCGFCPGLGPWSAGVGKHSGSPRPPGTTADAVCPGRLLSPPGPDAAGFRTAARQLLGWSNVGQSVGLAAAGSLGREPPGTGTAAAAGSRTKMAPRLRRDAVDRVGPDPAGPGLDGDAAADGCDLLGRLVGARWHRSGDPCDA